MNTISFPINVLALNAHTPPILFAEICCVFVLMCKCLSVFICIRALWCMFCIETGNYCVLGGYMCYLNLISFFKGFDIARGRYDTQSHFTPSRTSNERGEPISKEVLLLNQTCVCFIIIFYLCSMCFLCWYKLLARLFLLLKYASKLSSMLSILLIFCLCTVITDVLIYYFIYHADATDFEVSSIPVA